MDTSRELNRDEAEWLMYLSRGRTSKTPAELGMPKDVLKTLLRRGLIVHRGGLVQITTHGMADALRLSAPDSSHLAFLAHYGDGRLAVRGF